MGLAGRSGLEPRHDRRATAPSNPGWSGGSGSTGIRRTAFDVFDTEGRWIGHVNTPESWDGDPYPGTQDPYIKGDTIWAVVKEEFDVRYIARFEVEWALAAIV